MSVKEVARKKTKKDAGINLGVQYASKILEESNKPMSIDQIRGKFDPSFPFQVRCVINVLPDASETPYRVTHGGIPAGTVISIVGGPDMYGHYESNFSFPGESKTVCIHPSLEKWVLV